MNSLVRSSGSATSRVKTSYNSEVIRIKQISCRNLEIFRAQPWLELSGSFGDIGTFIPIFIVLTQLNLISASSTLVFSGLANILTGLFFGIPLPVQPMKAIAAVAISSGHDFTSAKLASAGLFVAGVVGLLSVTGLIRWFSRVIPIPVVKGIQVGAGFALMISAWPSGKYVREAAKAYPLLAGTISFYFFCSSRARWPFVLVIVLAVIIYHALELTLWRGYNGTMPYLSIWRPHALVPSPKDFGHGVLEAGIGQVPLTTLNSVIAVVFLADDLFPNVPSPSATSIGLSVTAMNRVGCWFGAMPFCHGSGGLAAQYRFGARSGTSVIFLGGLKLLLGLFASEFVVSWCERFPKPILSFLVFLAGLELVKMGESLNSEGARDLWEQVSNGDADSTEAKQFKRLSEEEKMRRYFIMTVTIGTILGTKNDGIGFIAGMIVHGAYKFQDWLEQRQSEREGRIRLGEDDTDHSVLVAVTG